MMGYVICLSTVCMMLPMIMNFTYAAEPEQPKEQAAAVVNGQRIPISDLDRELRVMMARKPELRSKVNIDMLRKVRKQLLNYLIERELLIQAGRKVGLEAQAVEIDAEFASVEQRFPSGAAFKQALEQEGLTEEKLRKLIERRLTVKKMLEIKIYPTAKSVADEDVVSFYEEKKEEFVEPEQVRSRHILIEVAPNADNQQKSDAKSKIQAILEKAKGGADFAELASEYSQCPSASQGGDLGYFSRGRLAKTFEDAAFRLQPGQLSEVVETQFGYHIILVLDRKPETQLEFEKVGERIKEFLHGREMNIAVENWLISAKEKATINILLED
jgi:peptidyl-prolyl cis-trans isomerase C